MDHDFRLLNQVMESPALTGCTLRVVDLDQRCRTLFQHTLWRGKCWRFRRHILNQPYRLESCPSLKDQAALQNCQYEGLHSVSLKSIIGSINFHQDFDASFFPYSERSMQRWVRLARIFMTGQPVPAVELILINGLYFVLDGHHRISVARASGVEFIDASVRVIHFQNLPDTNNGLRKEDPSH